MKKYYATVMLLMLTLLTGCFKQDHSLCVMEENCVLLFELEGTTRSSGFSSTITSVNVALFDKDGGLVTQERVNKEQLDIFQGVRLTVDPGIYYAVAWGNVTNSSELSTTDGTRIGESFLKTISDESGCNLYYAPAKEIEIIDGTKSYTPDQSLYKIDVKPNQVVQKKLPFTRANRRVSIYIKGIDDCSDVLMTNTPDSYDYFLRTYDTRKDYSQALRKVVYEPTGELLDAVTFRSPVAPLDDAVNINLLDKSSTPYNILYSLNLKEWVEKNASKIEDPLKINILISTYIDGSVSAEAVDWNDNNVKPIW